MSIVTATRNRSEFLPRALSTFAAQTLTDFESIVVDDGSDAETFAAYERLWPTLDARFRLEHAAAPGQPGRGPAAARNRGVTLARGQFVAFCDDDDRWVEADHLEVGVRVLEQTGADFYFTNMRGENGDVIAIPDWFPGFPQLTRGRRVHNAPAVYEVADRDFFALTHRHVPHPNCWIVRRTLFGGIPGFWERISYAEDLELTLRLVSRAKQILYRPDRVIGFNVAPRHSVFGADWTKPLEAPLQVIAGMLRAHGVAEHPAARKAARAFGAWHFRILADELMAKGRARAAFSPALQAFCLYPTLGGLWKLAGVGGRGVAEALCGRAPRQTS